MGCRRTAIARLAAGAGAGLTRSDCRFTKKWMSFGLTDAARPKSPSNQWFGLYPGAEGLPVDM